MEAKYEKICKDSKLAAEFLLKLSYLSPDVDIDMRLCSQIFEKSPDPPAEFSEDFQRTLLILKRQSAILLLRPIQRKVDQATSARINDGKFHTFLRKEHKDYRILLELAHILHIIIESGVELSFDMIPHVLSVKMALREESGGGGSGQSMGIRMKCWWTAKKFSRREILKKLNGTVSEKMDKIYGKHIEKLTVLARRDQILKNFDICQSMTDPLYQITLQDYNNWVFDMLVNYGDKCPKIYQIGVKSLGGLGRINILPENIRNEVIDYAAAYEEDGWDNFLFYISKSPLIIKNQDGELEKICHHFVRKLKLEFRRKDPVKPERWIRMWGFLKSLADDPRVGGIMQLELMTEPKGINLMAKALGVDSNVKDFSLAIWAKSQGCVLEILRGFVQDKSEVDCTRLEILHSKKFLSQMSSFLPRFLEQFKDTVLTMHTWKIIEPYFGVVMKVTESPVLQQKILDLKILNSIKSSLEIIRQLKAPSALGEDMVKNKFRVVHFTLLFCIVGRTKDKDRVKNFIQNFASELESFDYVGNCKNRKTWPWPAYWAEPLKNFVNTHKLSTPTSAVDTAVKIAQEILEGL